MTIGISTDLSLKFFVSSESINDLTSEIDRLYFIYSKAIQQLPFLCIGEEGHVYEERKNTLFHTFKNLIDKIAQVYKITLIDTSLSLPKELFLQRDISYEEYRRKSIRHDCCHFAFYTLKEPRIYPHLLGEPFPSTLSYPLINDDYPEVDEIVSVLSAWQYELVGDPEENDLIVYFDKGVFVHMGVITHESMVISKWGNLPIFTHPIEAVPENYGSSYLIFRKILGDGVYKEVKLLTDEIKGKISSFNHIATFSPLSPRGCGKAMLMEIKKKIAQRVFSASDKSPYGKAYFRKVNILIEVAFQNIEEVTSRMDMITSMDQNVLNVLKATPFM